MSSSGGGDINIGGGSGLYTVDGCAYSCGSNPAKWDGNHTYGQTLECKGLGVTPEEAEAGEAGPADLNCATDSSGKEICSDPDNPSCVTIDGISTCPSEGAICDELNGDLGCIDPAEEGCAYRNGKKECYDIFGQYIEHDSPDHPNNGGNMDGDTSNDMTDPRPEGEGGDPNNQPGDSTGEGGEATEGTAKESLEQQKIGNEKLDGIEESTGNIDEAIEAALDASRGDGTALKNGIDDAISNAGDSAVGDLDEHIDGIDSPAPMNEGDLGAIENNVTNLFAGSMQCRDLVFGTDEISYTITCNDMSMIRDMLGFLLYGFTVIRLFNVALRPAAKGTP
ncbi:hypothetical protein SAMN05216429_106129 [Marinobacter persicus]|uniref:TspB protein n=2 Tax=Marinobacter persicus TaxID=930118 RepID=A0A1I3UFZ3_9GAMM|nr:hypothetical protein SAMN05216429_106129 [Marinobacter persicus]